GAGTRPRRAWSGRWATWPELTVTGKATTATDVFAYGALLLEVACGRRPIDPVTGVNLLRWVRDLGVRGEVVRRRREARRVLRQGGGEAGALAGLTCSQARPEARPSMRQVCQYLDGEEHVPEEAVLVFSDADSVDFGLFTSLTWSSCATMSVGSLHGGR
uniref:Serine-threonine/tyrosine-protein kinase catalytic domain-containing protein n=1 Tax=Oryza brachyantha TaxID=4533 RepID=J3N4E1_ORYBR